MFLPYMYMHAYTKHAFTLYAGGEGGGYRSKVKRLYTIYVLPFEGCILYRYIYTHIVYMLLRIAFTYAQLFGNGHLAKSLIDRSIVPF